MYTLEKRSGTHLYLNITKMYSIVIALIPVIMIINLPILNMGMSTVLLGVFLPYAVFFRGKIQKKTINATLLICFAYLMFRSGGNVSNIFLLFVVVLHSLGAMRGSINIQIVRKTVETVAIIGTFCVLIQTLAYYVLGLRFSFLIPSLILEENRYSIIDISKGFFRPAAFFLEPSHYAQYCCVALMSVLFPLNRQSANLKKALLIVTGCVLTTSGMGIAICVGILGWYVLFTQRKKGTKLIYLIAWSLAAIIAFFILMQFSFFSMAVQRVFGEVDGYNAIWGRTLYWDTYVGSLSGIDRLIGHGSLITPEGYMTGLMRVIYCYGYIGVGFLLSVFITMFATSKSMYARCACVVYCALMCIANLFGFLSLTFWLCLIITEVVFASKNSITQINSNIKNRI